MSYDENYDEKMNRSNLSVGSVDEMFLNPANINL